MRLLNVVHVTGNILRLFGATFVVPIVVAALYREWTDIPGFVIGGVVSAGFEQILRVVSRDAGDDLRQIEALAVVAGAWLMLAGFGAVPYAWVGFDVVDALFESMSGITTTGATILTDFESPGHGLFFWRSMTQWLGGMGVITLVVAVLPRLAVGVRQLFAAEAPGPTEEKLAPQIPKTAAYLWRVYAGLTLAAFIALSVAGMPLYDALCHAMTTLSADGFSPHGQSIMGYANPAVEWIICVFMFLAGANFALQYRVLLGRPGLLLRDDEFKAYAGVVVLSTAVLGVLLWTLEGDTGPVRHATFQTLSILTTTEYASVDFELWSDQAKKVVPDHVMRGVLVFFLFYILTFAVCAAAVIGLGADIVTGLTATVASLGNISPGFGAVGPMASYGGLHPASKLVLTAAMWIGRLEVVTVLALLRPEVWVAAHWVGLAERRIDVRSM